MASSPAARKRSARRPSSSSSTSRRTPAPTPWWGAGLAPHVQWPGVTIEIPAVWVPVKKLEPPADVDPELDVRWRTVAIAGGRWESPDGRFYFDAFDADRACDFFPTYLRHYKAEFASLPFELLDYQAKLVIRPLFGWKRKASGMRQYRKVFVAVPKGNGKSPLASGIGLYLLLCDNEAGAEVYAAARDREQARIVFDAARVMVKESPDLDNDNVADLESLCEVYVRSIIVPSTHSKFQVLSADVDTKHGFNVHGLVFDELHTQPNRDLYETLYKGTGKRRQPVTFMITTAGDDDESICMEEWEYARRLISRTIQDDTYLPAVFEASEKDDWKSPDVWKRVNPGFGITIKEDYFERECLTAQNEPRKRNSFLQLHLNRWVSQAEAWIPIEWWDACPGLPPEAELLGAPRASGLDMAMKIDLTAWVVVLRLPLEKADQAVAVKAIVTEGESTREVLASLNFRIAVIPFFWIPEATMRDREKDTGIPWSVWREQGFVRVTEGAVIDYDRIFRDIRDEIVPRFNLKGTEFGYDPAFCTDLAQRLERIGLVPVETLQNYQMLSEPSQYYEALVRSGRVLHDENRVMRFCVENVAVKQDQAGRIRPVKPKRTAVHKKIDGVIANVMGLDRVRRMVDAPGSIYDDRMKAREAAISGLDDEPPELIDSW